MAMLLKPYPAQSTLWSDDVGNDRLAIALEWMSGGGGVEQVGEHRSEHMVRTDGQEARGDVW